MKKRSLKRHKGRVSLVPKLINAHKTEVGEYSLISATTGRVTAKQLASFFMTVKRRVPAGTKILPRVFATYPVTAKPLEVRMGKGKGSIDHKIARIRFNSVILDLTNTIPGYDYLEILRLSGTKLPVRTKVIKGLR